MATRWCSCRPNVTFAKSRIASPVITNAWDWRAASICCRCTRGCHKQEQQRIFQPTGGKRRIIFATNVAESSLTVPGIRYVIDAGTARISRYSARSKLQRSADRTDQPRQRRSTCRSLRSRRPGDLRAAVFGRQTTSRAMLSRRPRFAAPIWRRWCCKPRHCSLGPLEEFPLLDPPRPEAIREGIRTLIELGCAWMIGTN